MNDTLRPHVLTSVLPCRPRLPTVDEALQYTPLTSIVPFDAGIIPVPRAIPTSHHSTSLRQEEFDLAKQTFHSLNAETLKPRGTSARLEQTLKDLQHLLRADDLTQFNFQNPQLPQRRLDESNGQAHLLNGQRPRQSPKSNLASFAKMVLDSTSVSYRYPTPVSPDLISASNGFERHVDHQIPATALSPLDADMSNTDPFRQNAKIRVLPTPQTSPTWHHHFDGPTVFIPSLPSSTDPAQYQRYPEVDAAIIRSQQTSSRKRKREVEKHEFSNGSIGRQEQAQTTLHNLHELIANIFEAEDYLEFDMSDAVSIVVRQYFVNSWKDRNVCVLAPGTQTRLESAISKVVSIDCFTEVSTEQLYRLQKLCIQTLTSVNEIDLGVPDKLDDNEAEEWTLRIEATENSLRASKTLLRIMKAGKEEKQLCSEEMLLDLLQNLKHIVETCIISLVESRAKTQEADFFVNKPELKILVGTLLQRSGKVLSLIGDLLLITELSESSIAMIEDLSTKLIFVENAPAEKDSLLGVQKFEIVRRHAMDVVAKVFIRYPKQRQIIFDGILSSLEKLPVSRQSARQFKIIDGKPIQLVSALILQLVQTSASKSIQKAEKQDLDETTSADGGSADEADSTVSRPAATPRRRTATLTEPSISHEHAPIEGLRDVAKTLFDGAYQNANYVAQYLIQRALTSTKSGDTPYRHLLDIFTQDFVSVLGCTDWPAAELLLESLLSILFAIMDNVKSTAPARSMAIEIMGIMGSGIADLQNYISRSANNLELRGTGIDRQLASLAQNSLDGEVVNSELLAYSGPYRAVVEYLQGRNSEDIQLQSAISFYLIQWARLIWTAVDTSTKDLENDNADTMLKSFQTVASSLTALILDPYRIADQPFFASITAAQGRLSYTLTVLNMPFCKVFPRILGILLTSLSSPHSTVRSRSLKSVIQLLEKDPSILDRSDNVVMHTIRCASDPSTMVRDSALGLIGTCISLRPALEVDFCKILVARSSDTAIGVRKRAMKLLRDFYLRNNSEEVRAAIADALLQRVVDGEESISDLARQIIEDIWMAPFHNNSNLAELTVQARQNLETNVSIIVATAQRGENVLSVLETLFRGVLSATSKGSKANRSVCKALVVIMFDGIIDNEAQQGKPSQQSLFKTLTILAKADPSLFNAVQMTMLQPYIKNLSSTDNLVIYRSVIVIYRYVLPVLPPLQHTFLEGVQTSLLQCIQKLGKMELNEVSMCLWIIDGVLKNTDRLVRLMISVLNGIEAAKGTDLSYDSQQAALGRVRRYLMIAGYFGKACNFDPYRAVFQEGFPWWKDDSVSGLVVDIICPFSGPAQPPSIREMSLESICLVCQSWPKNFLKQEVSGAFKTVFHSRDPRLELVVLSGFKDFYNLEEVRSKTGSEIAIGDGAVHGSERLGTSMVLSDNDGASTTLAQQFLPYIIRIALATHDQLALLATEVIVSTNRQGLTHPKDCGYALVALETSPNAIISNLAFEEHRSLHHKHESLLEKEYLNAVEQAFLYQKNTCGQVFGYDETLSPKLRLFFEVLKSGAASPRKKLLANLVARTVYDPKKPIETESIATQLEYATFVLENLALFDYARSDEILNMIVYMEKVFATTGNVVSQHIESMLHLDQAHEQAESAAQIDVQIDLGELRRLVIASIILTIIWETRTHLRRAWSLAPLQDGKIKPLAKAADKVPVRSANVSSSSYLNKIGAISTSLNSIEAMISQCKTFVELLSTDSEVRIGSDGEVKGYETPDEEVEDVADDGVSRPPSAGKRNGTANAVTSPKKPRKGSRPSIAGRKKSTGLGRRKSTSKDLDDDHDGDWV